MKPKHPKDPGRSEFPPLLHPLDWLDAFSVPELYEWQREIMEAVAKPRSRVCVSTCNESGKTAVLIPLMGLAVMSVFPGSLVFSTAGVEEQIRGQLFKYLETKVNLFQKTGWTISTSDLVINGPDVHGLRSRWHSRVAKESNTLEGYHSRWTWIEDLQRWQWLPVCVIIDEAKSVKDEVFEAAYRIDPDFLFVISTPGEDNGPFYNAMESVVKSGKTGGHWDSKDGLWTYRRKVSWTECPHLLTPDKLAIRTALTKKYGANSSFIKSFLGGEFKRDSDENYVFTDHDVEAIRGAMEGKSKPITGERRAALDFSGGGDEQVIAMSDGNTVETMDTFREENMVRLAEIFVERLRAFKVDPWRCYADNGGIGLAVIDSMEEMGYRPIVRYMNNQDSRNKFEFADRMTEDHYLFKDKLHKNHLRLPNDPVLLKQIRQRKAMPDDHNRVKLEVKKKHRARTGDSPDRLDSLIMLFSEWVMPHEKEDKTNSDGDYVSPLETAAKKKRGGNRPFMDMIPQPDLKTLDAKARR